MASMHVRDASGRRVSLLNDESASHSRLEMSWTSAPYASTTVTSSYQYPSYRSTSSSPHTPELLRSESYDSQISTEPVSPLTPVFGYAQYPAGNGIKDTRAPFEDYPDLASPYTTGPRPHYNDSRSGSYDAESVTGIPTGEKTAKRYPCRFRESHNCEKTFTTSGHASRHSKIHTAEKAVPCSFEGCTKKFTRADNMKQHLDTHYKDKSRTLSSRPMLSSSERRSSSSGKTPSKPKAALGAPLPSPGGVWDMRGLSLPLHSRPAATRNPSAGLDALAMAVACQQDL